MWDKISALLKDQPDLLKDFEWYMEKSMYAEEDLCVANAKLEGVWGGWEWIKGNMGEPMVKREVLEKTTNALKECSVTLKAMIQSQTTISHQLYGWVILEAEKELERTVPLYPQ
jgi:hypothetical protein